MARGVAPRTRRAAAAGAWRGADPAPRAPRRPGERAALRRRRARRAGSRLSSPAMPPPPLRAVPRRRAPSTPRPTQNAPTPRPAPPARGRAARVVALDAAQPFDFEHRARAALAREQQLTIGIVGFGTFGQFLAKRMAAAGHRWGVEDGPGAPRCGCGAAAGMRGAGFEGRLAEAAAVVAAAL
jgi:hypothetical protein